MGIMITYHGPNNGHNNPMYNAQNVGVCTRECIMHSKIQYFPQKRNPQGQSSCTHIIHIAGGRTDT